MHELRVSQNMPGFDGYNYDTVGRDKHIDNFVEAAENNGVLHRDFVGMIQRDLRAVVMHRA